MTNYNQLKTSRGFEVKIFRKKSCRIKREGTFTSNEKSSHKNIQYSSRLLPRILPHKFISWTSKKSKMRNCIFFTRTKHSGDSHWGISTTSNISIQLKRTWSCLKHVLNNFILSAPTSVLSVLFFFCGCFLADVWYLGVFSAKKRRCSFPWSNAQ